MMGSAVLDPLLHPGLEIRLRELSRICNGQGVHPAEDPDTGNIMICLFDGRNDFLLIPNDRQQPDLRTQFAGMIQRIRDILCIFCNVP